MGVSLFVRHGKQTLLCPYGRLQDIRVLLLHALYTYLDSLSSKLTDQQIEAAREDDADIDDTTQFSSEVANALHAYFAKQSVKECYKITAKSNNDDDVGKIEYLTVGNFSQPPIFEALGILKFISHSDCDGHHSMWECREISAALKILKDFIPKDMLTIQCVEATALYIPDLLLLFDEADKTNSFVSYA